MRRKEMFSLCWPPPAEDVLNLHLSDIWTSSNIMCVFVGHLYTTLCVHPCSVDGNIPVPLSVFVDLTLLGAKLGI